jgi:MinD-like ATPase involved in chromosome partitioning or flagellar assembly
MTADIALAASAREWPDRLHRFLLDHGGGRVVDRVMSADQAQAGRFDVLLIDDICSFLTPRLVTVLKRGGSEVIGVFAPEDGSDAKRRLLECGISDVIETGASPEEFIEKIVTTLAHRLPILEFEEPGSDTVGIAVTGPSAGVGITEVAVSLAVALAERTSTVLLDIDPVWPSVAQRMGLSLHPNIRTAIDHSLHSPDRLPEAICPVESLGVIGGRADFGHGAPISRHEVVSLLDCLGDHTDVVVADVGPAGDVQGGLLGEFDTILAVGAPDPVGVTRLLKTVGQLQTTHPNRSVLGVVNMVGRGGFRGGEVTREIQRSFPDLTLVTLPFDPRVSAAAWDGRVDAGRSYSKSMAAVADVVVRSLR